MQQTMRIHILFREVWRDYRQLFPLLMAAALIVYVPITLVDAVTGTLSTVDDRAGTFEIIQAVLAGVVGALFSLLGAVVYAAIVSVLVHRNHGIHEHPLADALRALPYGRLIGADLVYSLMVAAALLLLIVPGLVLMTWYALIAPAIEIEDLGIRDALRRSHELVRPHFWKMLLVVVPLMFGSNLISDLAWSGATGALGEGLVGDWLGNLVAELITAPFLGLFLVLAFLGLRAAAE